MEAAAENQPDQVPQEVPAPEDAAPEPVPEVVPQVVVREVDADEAARHEVRMARQVAIRHGLYLPPLPAPQLPFPQAILAARNLQLQIIEENREELMALLRVENFRHRLAIGHGIDYRPLSPDNSDDEPDEVMEAHQRQRRERHQWNHYMHQRREPIPQELVDQLVAEHGRNVNRVMGNLPQAIPGINHPFNNNNRNFRNFNGVLSPSPSPSPGATPVDSEDEEPMMGGEAIDDEDVEMLNIQFEQMRPNYARARKRQNSKEPVAIKRKRVTFKTDSDDEGANSDNEEEMDDAVSSHHGRKENEDDDEGFFGGPSRMQRNVSCS